MLRYLITPSPASAVPSGKNRYGNDTTEITRYMAGGWRTDSRACSAANRDIDGARCACRSVSYGIGHGHALSCVVTIGDQECQACAASEPKLETHTHLEPTLTFTKNRLGGAASQGLRHRNHDPWHVSAAVGIEAEDGAKGGSMLDSTIFPCLTTSLRHAAVAARAEAK